MKFKEYLKEQEDKDFEKMVRSTTMCLYGRVDIPTNIKKVREMLQPINATGFSGGTKETQVSDSVEFPKATYITEQIKEDCEDAKKDVIKWRGHYESISKNFAKYTSVLNQIAERIQTH